MNIAKLVAVLALLTDAVTWLAFGHPIIAALWIAAAAITTWILPAR